MEPRIYTVTPQLRKILADRKMTQLELSEISGIPQSAISRFDTNKQHSDLHLVAISKALQVSIEDLFHIAEVSKEQEKDAGQ